MKKLLLIATLMASQLAAVAAEGLRVTPTTGEPVTFLFSEKPEVSFTGTRLKVTSTAQPSGVYFEMDGIEMLDFTKDSSLDELPDGGIEVRSDAAGVHFSCIPEGAMVAVYSISGTAVHTGECRTGEYHLLRADVPVGIYIVKINQLTLKTAL